MTSMTELAVAVDSPDPAEALAAVAALRKLTDELEALHVRNARAQGLSWEARARQGPAGHRVPPAAPGRGPAVHGGEPGPPGGRDPGRDPGPDTSPARPRTARHPRHRPRRG